MKYIKSRNQFLKEDLNLAKSIINKKMADFEKIKELLKNNVGYIGKFTEYLMNENIPFIELESLYKDLLKLKEKNHPININNLSYEKVLDQIQTSQENISINSLLNMFPSTQKNLAKELLKEDRYRKLLMSIAIKPNLNNFVSKISRYKDRESLIDILKVFAKDLNNQKEKVIETLKDLKSEIIINTDKILIVKIDSYEDIKILGSDTSWCIVSSKSTYDSYVKGRFQFILYNYELEEFDPKFKIGFTLTRDGHIHACYDILDKGCSDTLKSILVDNNLELINLIPKVEKIDFNLAKLTSKTSSENLLNIVETCDLEEIPSFVAKVLNFRKNHDTISKIGKKAFFRLYNHRGYALKSEVEKISLKFWDINQYNEILIDENKLSIFLKETALNKALTIWDPEVYNINNYIGRNYITYAIDYLDNRGYSKEILKKLSNRINEIYSQDLVKFNPNYSKQDKGYKLSKGYEALMLVLNLLVGRLEETPNYAELIKISNPFLGKYNSDIKTPIDLSLNSTFTLENIDSIIKKDYEIYIELKGQDSLVKYAKLSEHLKDHKLKLKIGKDHLKLIINSSRYIKNEETQKIMDLCQKFNLGRLVSGKSFTDGNLTIQVY